MADQLTLDKNNSTYDYRYTTTFGSNNVFDNGYRFTYNGVPVVYVPKEYAQKGYYDNGTQYLQPAFLNKDVWTYLKPVRQPYYL